MTAKQRVLKRYPKAFAKYAGLSLSIVIVNDFRGPEISLYRSRERDAWASAAKLLRRTSTTAHQQKEK